MMKIKFNYCNNLARVCHSLAACQWHTPSSQRWRHFATVRSSRSLYPVYTMKLARRAGWTSARRASSSSQHRVNGVLRCVRCVGWKPRLTQSSTDPRRATSCATSNRHEQPMGVPRNSRTKLWSILRFTLPEMHHNNTSTGSGFC